MEIFNKASLEMPLVSVMMPVYNGERTIEIAIKSLLMQTYTNWLCIIVNDGSTDGTSDILKQYEKNKRFKIIQLEVNKGRGNARQVALNNVIGKYLAFLDADDLYHPEKIQRQVNILENDGTIDLVSCANASFDNHWILKTVRDIGNNIVSKYVIDKSKIALRSSMIRTELARLGRFNVNFNFAEDYAYINNFMGNKMYLITNEIHYYYSEYQSVTKYKIILTNFYGIKYYMTFFHLRPLSSSRQIFKNLIKIMVKLIILPILPLEFFLNQRGRIANENELFEFKSIIERILKY